jgi:hypothetical protein
MKLSQVLTQLKKHNIEICFDETNLNGERIIIVGCALPSPPFVGGRFQYYTLTLSPGQDEVTKVEREAMKRRLWHRTTDIFGDDGEEDDFDPTSDPGFPHM